MAVSRTHHYSVDPANLDELLARRARLIEGVRAAHPGLTETRLTRLEDGTYTDVWRWESAEQMRAAQVAGDFSAAGGETMSLTRDASAQNGEIIDER